MGHIELNKKVKKINKQLKKPMHIFYTVKPLKWKIRRSTPTNRNRGRDTAYLIRMQK